MFEGEGQGGEGFATAGGHGEAEKSRRERRFVQGVGENVCAQCIERRGGGTGACLGHEGAEAIAQVGQRPVTAARHRRAGGAGIEALGGDEVRIHKAGEQHAHQKAYGEALRAAGRRWLIRSQLRALRQRARVLLPATRNALPGRLHAPRQVRVIGEARMVRGDDDGQDLAELRAIPVQRDPSTGGGVVAAGWPLMGDVGLEFRRELADVVQLPGKTQHLGPSEVRGERRRECPDRGAVIGQCFPLIQGRVGKGMGIGVGHGCPCMRCSGRNNDAKVGGVAIPDARAATCSNRGSPSSALGRQLTSHARGRKRHGGALMLRLLTSRPDGWGRGNVCRPKATRQRTTPTP
nr:hypothetical protein [Xanthobacter sp. NM-25]